MWRYEAWLKNTQKEIRQAIEEAEDGGWHHLTASPDTRTRIQILARLRTWETEVTERVDHYDDSKSRR